MSQLKVNSIIPVAGVPTGGGGGIIQVVELVKSDVVSASPGTTFADISGMAATITPTSSTSKVLVSVAINCSATDIVGLNLLRGSTNILQGDAVSGKTQVSAAIYSGSQSNGSNYYGGRPINFSKLDSPNTTSAVTYKIQWQGSSVITLYLNRNMYDAAQYAFRTASTITLMEVSA
tara:strand:- start:56 stop:583 length:528 start_codon:yes stop_codon:yes gene_type:complete